ncbi:MAG TPA: HD domain-containing phosphohydrolase [Anaeromyxobacter sp.]|nr:HD domain-containing phosphohydrolase [Anaeromyxobacter sp.]
MFDRLILTEELADCRGDLVAARGTVLSPESIAEAAARAPRITRRPLAETPLAADVDVPLGEERYRFLFQPAAVRDAVRRLLLATALPDALFAELLALRRAGSPIHGHAFATAAIAVRMLLGVVGEARGVPELAGAALLHDIGMRHVPPYLAHLRDKLGRDEAERVAAHPLLGAYHLARTLGPHPAVQAALGHHWRCGQGYPSLVSTPSRSMEVVSVASAFAALTQPRPYRSAAYDARGAADVLVQEAMSQQADANTVKLLVHALRGGAGDPRQIRFGREREGHAPDVNRHAPIAAPSRSPV